MERKTAIAFVIIFAAYFLLFMNRQPPPQQPGGDSLAVVPPQLPVEPQPVPELPAEDTTRMVISNWDGAPAPGDTSEFVLSSTRSRMRFHNPGGVLKQLDLLKYLDLNRDHDLDLIPSIERARSALGLTLVLDGRTIDLQTQAWKITAPNDSTLVMETRVGEQLHITKQVHISAEAYAADVQLAFENLTATPLNIDYTIYGPCAMVEETAARGAGVGATYGKTYEGGADVELITRSDVQKAEGRTLAHPDMASFVGLANAHFATALIPRGERPFGVRFWAGPEEDDDAVPPPHGVFKARLHTGLEYRNVDLPGGEVTKHNFELLGIPKDPEILEKYKDIGLDQLRDLGWFASIGDVFLSILDVLYGLTGNYGWAIILLTVMIRLLLHPLSRFSQKNMQKMQLLAPKVEEIKKKYEGKTSKEAKGAMNQEVMALYQSHGANPMLGCLPMFLQIPIFIGLYQAILSSLKLRQQAFLTIGDWVWPVDLSLPDQLFTLPFTLPWPLETSSLNLLPLVVMVVMFVQQSITPKAKDPQQQATQKMMKFFMVFIAVFFYNLPSGLLLYWGTSSAIGLAESVFVKKSLAAANLGGTTSSAPVVSESKAKVAPEQTPSSKSRKGKKKGKKKR